ncbi:MAG: hypothetical protein IJI24_03485 [Lachnospiraceae bacterium]|nr:hypothetical protein [Lachnospiraceae bacterium]
MKQDEKPREESPKEQKIHQQILTFRMELLRKMPFYGDLLSGVEIVSSKDNPTAWTDGSTIYYNPSFMMKQNEGQMHFVIMHEILHMLLMHCYRVGKRDPFIWNIAADVMVNGMLTGAIASDMKKRGIAWGEPVGIVKAWVSESIGVEDIYYHILADNQSKDVKQNKPAAKKVVFVRRHYTNKASDKGDVPDHAWDKPTNIGTYYAIPEKDLFPAKLSDRDLQGLEDRLREYVSRAAKSDSGRSMFGSCYIPPDLYKLVKTRELNWKRLLRDLLTDDVDDDEASYQTPERKYIHMDLILPGHSFDQENLEEVWAFVDSSGSIGKDDMAQFLTQIYRIVKDFQCTYHICYWDTKVTDVYRNVSGEKKVLECVPHHSGGTNINCVYDWMAQNHVRPTAMIIFTDGYFGTLTTKNFRRSMQENTILVLSRHQQLTESHKKIGKIAYL